MKLVGARVQNFRSIVDSGTVEVDDRVTVLVGKNEQGKTNFLRALYSFNRQSSYTPGDFPNHLRAELEDENESEIPIVTIWVVPTPSEREHLGKLVPELEKVDKFKVTRVYDGEYRFASVGDRGKEKDLKFAAPDISEVVENFKKEAELLRTKLDAHATRLAPFGGSKPQYESHIKQFESSKFTDLGTIDNLVKTLVTALKGLPGQDGAIQADIAASGKTFEEQKIRAQHIFEANPATEFLSYLPHFVLHSALLDNIPKEVNIADFTKDPEGTSKGMANLCKVAGLSIQKIQELASTVETETREAHEDHYKASMSGAINEFWHQVTYQVHFRFESDRLSVSISDSNYDRRIAPTERSDGFQWYLSFYSAIQSEVSVTDSMVLLLDNPGLEIHPDGQRDIKRFLEEKLPETTQVVYVTHSPAMIDTYNLAQVRRVEHLGNNGGTRVSGLPLEGGQLDLLEPLRSAIGASLVDTLMTNRFNVLVEGAADKPILEGALRLLRPHDFEKVAINGSVAESKLLLPLFYKKSGLPFVVLLDGDSGGRELKSKLESGGIDSAHILYLGDFSGKNHDHELEDLVSGAFYHKAVIETYPEHSVVEEDPANGKRTKQYEAQFRTNGYPGFNKRRVAETIKRLLDEGKGDEETKTGLRPLGEKIWESLQAQ